MNGYQRLAPDADGEVAARLLRCFLERDRERAREREQQEQTENGA